MKSVGADNPPGPFRDIVFRLFVAGNEPHSRRAKENLDKICAALLMDADKIEIVDVLEDYQAALDSDIFFTPALLVNVSGSTVTIYGDLSDGPEVVRAMGLEMDN
jgi:hypothetical protein